MIKQGDSGRHAGVTVTSARYPGLAILFAHRFELRQNASLTRLSLEVSKNNLLADIELGVALPERAAIWVKSYMTPEQLTDVEKKFDS